MRGCDMVCLGLRVCCVYCVYILHVYVQCKLYDVNVLYVWNVTVQRLYYVSVLCVYCVCTCSLCSMHMCSVCMCSVYVICEVRVLYMYTVCMHVSFGVCCISWVNQQEDRVREGSKRHVHHTLREVLPL